MILIDGSCYVHGSRYVYHWILYGDVMIVVIGGDDDSGGDSGGDNDESNDSDDNSSSDNLDIVEVTTKR